MEKFLHIDLLWSYTEVNLQLQLDKCSGAEAVFALEVFHISAQTAARSSLAQSLFLQHNNVANKAQLWKTPLKKSWWAQERSNWGHVGCSLCTLQAHRFKYLRLVMSKQTGTSSRAETPQVSALCCVLNTLYWEICLFAKQGEKRHFENCKHS